MGKDVVYIYTMGFYSAIKKNEILLSKRWMDLEDIVPSKVSQTEKDKNCDITYMWNLNVQPTSDYNRKKQTQKEQT